MTDLEKLMTKHDTPSGWSLFGQAILALPLSLVTNMAVAKCIEPMWAWFITPVTGAAVPAFWVLVGFIYALSLFTFNIKKRDLDETDTSPFYTAFRVATIRLTASVMILGLGWVVHLMV